MRLKRKGKDREPAALGSIIEREFRAFGSPPVPFNIVQAWDQAVGERVARRARPARLLGDCLVVRVASNAWMTELQMLSPTILEKLCERSRFKGITSLRFELGELPRAAPNARPRAPETTRTHGAGQPLPSPIAEALNRLDDPVLREKIESALARTLSKKGA